MLASPSSRNAIPTARLFVAMLMTTRLKQLGPLVVLPTRSLEACWTKIEYARASLQRTIVYDRPSPIEEIILVRLGPGDERGGMHFVLVKEREEREKRR